MLQLRAYRSALLIPYARAKRSRHLSYPFTDLTQRHQHHRSPDGSPKLRIVQINLEQSGEFVNILFTKQ